MEYLGPLLIFIGSIASISGWVWGMRIAFRESDVYGIACIIVPMLLIYLLSTKSIRTWPSLILFVGGLIAAMYGVKIWK